MRKTFGTTANSNYKHFTVTDGGDKGINFPALVTEMKGIYSMVSPTAIQSTWASGHADMLLDGQCVFGCHFYDVQNQIIPIDYIDIWILN